MCPVSAATSAEVNGAGHGGGRGGGGPAARARSRTPDRLCADAVALAREVAEQAAHPQRLGAHLGVEAEGDRLVTHFFASEDPGYPGWRWGVTLTRASRSKQVTVDEVALTPGPDALLAPEWVPWSERLRPGDLRPGDLLPAEFDDTRLEPGYLPPAGELPPDQEPPGPADPAARSATDQPAEPAEPAQAPTEASVTAATTEEAVTAEEAAEAGAPAGWAAAVGRWASGAEPTSETVTPPPDRGAIADVARQLGLGRSRVLSWYGLHDAADRWDEHYGPQTPMAQAAPASCVSCGFLVPMAGSLRQAFGVCANEFSPADGHVVSLAYGCGAHSEAAESPKPEPPAPPVIDHLGADPL